MLRYIILFHDWLKTVTKLLEKYRSLEKTGWGTHVYLWWIHFDIWQN